MPVATIDIVVPIWNRPNETRNCLVSLLNHTPDLRFIMLDCGSERETERMLEEFADGLDDQALLMRDDSNIGFVPAANRGLARAEAPFVALVRNTTVTPPGWLDPLLSFAAAHPQAGILVPALSCGGITCDAPVEVNAGSFAAMVIRREALGQVGLFDEGMDDGPWCLKDYTRRASSMGFSTHLVPGPLVECQDDRPLGSERRREEKLHRSMAIFEERWGVGGCYVMHVPKGVDAGMLSLKLDLLLKGARRGDQYFVLLPSVLEKAARLGGFAFPHENIRLVPLPRFATDSGRRRLYDRIVSANPKVVPVSAVDGIPFPWSDSYLSFSALADEIDRPRR